MCWSGVQPQCAEQSRDEGSGPVSYLLFFFFFLTVPCELPAPLCSQSRHSHDGTDLNINAQRPSLCEISKSYLPRFFLLIPELLWIHKAWTSSMSELIMALSHFKAPLRPLNTYWCPLCEVAAELLPDLTTQRSASLVGTSSLEKQMKYKWGRGGTVVNLKATGGHERHTVLLFI